MITLNASLETALPKESVAIAALLRDVCKAEIYKQVVKRQMNSEGYWVDTLAYDVDYSSFPIGHGEKSVIVILRSGFKLTDDEIIAIRGKQKIRRVALKRQLSVKYCKSIIFTLQEPMQYQRR